MTTVHEHRLGRQPVANLAAGATAFTRAALHRHGQDTTSGLRGCAGRPALLESSPDPDADDRLSAAGRRAAQTAAETAPTCLRPRTRPRGARRGLARASCEPTSDSR